MNPERNESTYDFAMARIPAATKAQLLDLCPLSSMEKTDVDGESELEEAPTPWPQNL